MAIPLHRWDSLQAIGSKVDEVRKLGKLPNCPHCQYSGNRIPSEFCAVCGTRYPIDVRQKAMPSSKDILDLLDVKLREAQFAARRGMGSIAKDWYEEAEALKTIHETVLRWEREVDSTASPSLTPSRPKGWRGWLAWFIPPRYVERGINFLKPRSTATALQKDLTRLSQQDLEDK